MNSKRSALPRKYETKKGKTYERRLYTRFYKRSERTKRYEAINMDVAGAEHDERLAAGCQGCLSTP
jgi:hypothetical protein